MFQRPADPNAGILPPATGFGPSSGAAAVAAAMNAPTQQNPTGSMAHATQGSSYPMGSTFDAVYGGHAMHLIGGAPTTVNGGFPGGQYYGQPLPQQQNPQPDFTHYGGAYR